jgi:hypothetical protein
MEKDTARRTTKQLPYSATQLLPISTPWQASVCQTSRAHDVYVPNQSRLLHVQHRHGSDTEEASHNWQQHTSSYTAAAQRVYCIQLSWQAHLRQLVC